MSNPTTYYRVSIATMSGTTNGDGFIDNTSVSEYIASGSATPNATLWARKVRGNIRYREIIESLNSQANMNVIDVVAGGSPNASTEPTSFAFTVAVERGNSVLTVNDELNTGNTLTGTAAIKRLVARPLTISKTEPVARVQGNPIGATAGSIATSISNAETNITVTTVYTPDP